MRFGDGPVRDCPERLATKAPRYSRKVLSSRRPIPAREFCERPGASDLDNRPALAELLEERASNGVRVILIERLERLERDVLVQEGILAETRKRGFELVSALEPDLFQDDDTRILLRQILGSIARYDKAMIAAKLRSVRNVYAHARAAKRHGHLPGAHARVEDTGDITCGVLLTIWVRKATLRICPAWLP